DLAPGEDGAADVVAGVGRVGPIPCGDGRRDQGAVVDGRGGHGASLASRVRMASRSDVKVARTLAAVSVTSAWDRGAPPPSPAAWLVMQLMPRTRAPMWTAAMVSGTVDIPAASAPMLASMRISAGVS